MTTIGVDAHKRVHVAVAVDDAGREVARWSGPNSPTGWRQLGVWGTTLGPACRWGIEGAWNYGRGLAQDLIVAGATVCEVNPRWTAPQRQRARKPGKHDRLDARAVALLVWREAARLPAITPDDETVVLDVLVTEREGAVAEATRLRHQVHQLLLQRDPESHTHPPSLRTSAGVAAAASSTATAPGPLAQHRAGAVRRLAER